MPAPLKGRRVRKLACPRSRRIFFFLGGIKGLGNFPGDRKEPTDCFTREHAVIYLIKSSRGGFYTNEPIVTFDQPLPGVNKKYIFSKATDERDVVWRGYLHMITEKQIQIYYQVNIVNVYRL